MRDIETTTTQAGSSRSTIRSLLLAITLLAIVASGALGAAAWLKTTTDRSAAMSAASLASTEDALGQSEAALARALESLAEADADNARLVSEATARDEKLAAAEFEFSELHESVAAYIAASMALLVGAEEDVSACIAEVLIHDQGSAAKVMDLLTDGMTTPSVTASPVLQLGVSIFRAADECDTAIPAITAAYVETVAYEVALTGSFIESGTPVTRQAAASAVATAGESGEALYVVVLSEEPPIPTHDFADGIVEIIGFGTALVVGPETVGYATIDSGLSPERLDVALEASLLATSDSELIEIFVVELFG